MARKFENMSLKNQKIAIIEDALIQIKAKKIIPSRGDYISVKDTESFGDRVFLKNKDSLQDTLLKENIYCECCAKGGLFASCVILDNKVTGKHDYRAEHFIKDRLDTWFTPLELDMIEAAFEKAVIEDSTNQLEYYEDFEHIITKLGSKCIKFGQKYETAEKRMIGILKNILKHGEFKP